jgi:transcriptional regulator CtsR
MKIEEDERQRFITKILTRQIDNLIKDQYANYVVQNVLTESSLREQQIVFK